MLSKHRIALVLQLSNSVGVKMCRCLTGNLMILLLVRGDLLTQGIHNSNLMDKVKRVEWRDEWESTSKRTGFSVSSKHR